MNPVVAALIVGALTTLGRWARGSSLTIDTVVGVVGVAVGLAVVDQLNKPLARGLGALVVVGVAVAHLPVVLQATTTTTTTAVRPAQNPSATRVSPRTIDRGF